MLAKKKARKATDQLVASAAIESGCALTTLLSSFASHNLLSQSARTARKTAGEILYKGPNTDTPFGRVCITTTIQGKNGPLEVYHVNPAAMLYLALMSFPPFLKFLEACQTDSGAEFLTVAIYLDEAVPGNQNRPDRGRASQCLYWTIADYPAWFISRAAGWAPFAYVLLVEQKAAGVSDSLLVTMMAKAFTNELGSELDCDFAIVVGRCTFKFKMKMQVADWPQHSKTFNLKGHQGSLCCCWCSNCLGHCPEFDDDRT